MIGRPLPSEAGSVYFKYIDLAVGDDPLRAIGSQLPDALRLFQEVSEEKSQYRYAPDKWSLRQLLNHVTDTERAFAFRAMWFARGFAAPLPGYDQNIAAAGASADTIPWADHVEEFQRVRLSTESLFHNLPAEAWMRSGIASENTFTVRALAFITVGHAAHHMQIMRERYL